MLPEVLTNTIKEYADAVVCEQIRKKCSLNLQVRDIADVLGAMCFRQETNEAIGYFANPMLARAIWDGGMRLIKRQDLAQFRATEESVHSFPSVPGTRIL
jgi:hypothetical protein